MKGRGKREEANVKELFSFLYKQLPSFRLQMTGQADVAPFSWIRCYVTNGKQKSLLCLLPVPGSCTGCIHIPALEMGTSHSNSSLRGTVKENDLQKEALGAFICQCLV